ncbi:MAG: PSD1 and planctomycete cytochrome C domain-containing protein [Verrucomicrobiales bacterium]|nr:PSD1 and planctomycete cytochrome C domain-containing protein [Verrucomicrobiales bacterium]
MTKTISILTTAVLLALPHVQANEISEADRLFTMKVKPIFTEKCNGCHGDDPEKIKGDYDMLTREKLLAGGESFGKDVIVVGDAAKSFFIEAIKWQDPDFEMPPKENDRLTPEQIEDIESWINAGAPWPAEEIQIAIREQASRQLVTDEGMIVKTSGGLADEWTFRRYQPEDIWAFLPLKKPAVPEVKDLTGYSRGPNRVQSGTQQGTVAPNPVDSFIWAKMEAEGFHPAPKADPFTLIRRASFDLIGMPPTPEEIVEFQAAYKKDSAKAWSDLIGRLLSSKHYGERWSQHWLDVARYADTGGFSNDYERSNAWRYRDYVIRALNEDKPYNEFVVEQLAGDELADRSLRSRISDWNKYQNAREKGDQYNEKESELLVASSFLRMGPWDPAMVKKEEARQLYLDDVVNAVGQTFLSTTMRCFKCHDHKFDPLPTKDYYRMYAAFAGTQLAERPAPFLADESLSGFEESREITKELFNFAKQRVSELTTKRENESKRWYKEHNLPYKSLKDRADDPDEMKPPRHCGLTPEETGKLKVREQDVWIWERRMERYEPFVQTVYNGPVGFQNARKLRMKTKANNKWRPDSTILTGGSLEAKGDPVTPGVLSALGIPVNDNSEDPYQVTGELEGRRLDVANWIANPENPLTARSIVNRVWQYHFGKPVAGNPNNFGVKGGKPTHPEMLDWLAVNFVERGWKLKDLHRLIMTSQTYQQSGEHPDRYELANKDPDNNLFAYFPSRRLSAEELRDSMLRITGELNPDGGGLPIRPEMNMEVALQPRMIQFSIAPAYQPSPTPEERNRRSIYAYRVRGLANPFLETFNQPNPNDSCEERDSASVSPQAFTLLNSDMVTARSIAFARRVENEVSGIEAQVSRSIQLAFGRTPTDAEQAKMIEYVTEMQDYHKKVDPEPIEYPTRITRSLVEEFTGDPFEYEEILPVFKNYTPDTHASEVGPETRALADLCLLLFNSNEFVFSY